MAARSQQLPQLQGSEKQVAWANAIRDKMISENQLAQGIRDGEFLNPDGTVLTFQQAQEFWATVDFTPEEKTTADAVINRNPGKVVHRPPLRPILITPAPEVTGQKGNRNGKAHHSSNRRTLY